MLKKNVNDENTVEELIAAGKKAREHGFVSEAIHRYQSALESNVLSFDQEALVRCQLSEALEKAGLYREQIETIRKYDNVKGIGRLSPQTQIAVLIRLGWAFSFNNDIPRAVAFFNQVLHTVLPDDLKSRAASHAGLGRSYRVFTEIQFARDHCTTALEYYRRIGDLSGLAESHLSLVSVEMREGDHLEAIALIKQAFALLADSKDSYLLATAYQYLAFASYFLDDLFDNIRIYEGQLDNVRKTGAVGMHGSAANNYAVNLIAIGKWDKAEELALEAIDLLTQTSNVAVIAQGMDTLASIYLLRGNIERADDLLKESIRLTESIASGEWSEITPRTTLGRCCLIKGEFELAIRHFERALEICVRMGNYQHRRNAQVWLAEAFLQAGKPAEAIVITESLRSDLRESPDIDAWGFLARVISKLEFGRGHIAGALQLLNQSSSVFEVRGAIYDRAVNRVLMAQILERSGKLSEAHTEVELARADFEFLGARIDRERAVEYLRVLNDQRVTRFTPNAPLDSCEANPSRDLVSILDGFMTERILDASISRKLLLHELAAISREQAQSKAAIVIETSQPTAYKIAASVGFKSSEQQTALSLIAGLDRADYQNHFIYSFTDHHESSFLLQIIDPTSERFLKERVNFRPLLYAVEYGLQKQLLRTKARKRPVFEPIRVLAEAEMEGFICKSQSMTRVLEQIHKIRSSKAAVLITGESGTGKEVVARAIHAASARQFGTFLPFNCSSVAHEMVESQLFGFRKGAFTGASANSEGVIRAAERGTLFLDEIGEMPIDLQPKLLRFLQEGEIHPLGESKPIKVDVRLVAATNVDLEKEVAKGRFREDLFYRLNVIRVHVPPLRERREEIPALIAYYLKKYQQEEGKTEIALSQEAIDLMIVYDWPGNVRQLCNELRRLVAYNESGSTLNVDSLSSEIVGPGQVWFSKPEKSKTEADLSLVDPKQTLAEATDDLERNMIRAALRRSSGNIAQAAKELGLSRGGLYLKMNRLKLQV